MLVEYSAAHLKKILIRLGPRSDPPIGSFSCSFMILNYRSEIFI